MRWDHVVVGAGPAGCVVASRLSADPARSVLLLEAGPDERAADTPAPVAGPSFVEALAEPERLWADVATRTAAQGPRPYLRGRGTGGGAAVNAMVCLPGEPDDYDRWAADGCDGWAWSDLAPLWASLPLPMLTLPTSRWGPASRALAAASGLAVEAATLNQRAGRRVTTADTLLEPAGARANLEVRGNTEIVSVLIEGARAYGVRTAGGEDIEGAEVIVCAGAIQSPAILLRSGIHGRHGAVGANLIDHASARALLRVVDGAPRTRDHVGALARFSSGLFEAGRRDLQLLPLDGMIGPDGGTASSVAVALMRVFSRGSVTLDAVRPAGPPLVRFDTLSDERDLSRLVAAVRRLCTLVQHPAVRAFTAGGTIGENDTSPELLGELADDALAEWLLRHNIDDYVHAAGSCRMGAVNDPAAVVDPQCRVIDVDHLSVIDASVMPDLPRANPHVPTVLVAERAMEFRHIPR